MKSTTATTKTLQPPRGAAVLVLGGALIGAALFLVLYGAAPLDVTRDGWLRGGYVERDTLQHYAGWLFYRASPWSFPLGVAQNAGWPAGTYVGLSDSLPLFAVFFKLLGPLLPATFQYFGWWGFLCSAGQGAAAALLLSLFTTNRLQNWLLCLPFVLAPILLDRQLRHGALAAQWLILLALWLYFKHRRAGTCASPGFVVLCALSILIHPYFTPMVFALLLALLVQHTVATRQLWRPLAMLGACLAATLALGWVFGVFYGSAAGGSTMYGYFSMNLNALFNPAALDADWSLFLPGQNQLPGNYDGFNYLGLGVLATLLVMAADALLGLFGRKRSPWPLLRRHLALAAVCLCLTLFAVSNVVTAQGRVLFTLPLPQWLANLAGVLRSSGRMFYPVWYLLLLACCVYLLRRPLPRLPRAGTKLLPPLWLRTAAVGLLVAVQLLDCSPGLLAKAASLRPYTAVASATGLQSGLWQSLAGQYGHLVSLDDDELAGTVDLALYAATSGMTTSDRFTARYDKPRHEAQVQQARQALREGRAEPGSLYISSSEPVFLELAGFVDDTMFCAAVDGRWFVIAPYTDDFSDWPADGSVVRFADYPLTLADYSDELWDAGVLRADARVACFYDSEFSRRRINGMAALQTPGGTVRTILNVSYEDAGWILVTFGGDAGELRGQPLAGVPAKVAP